MRDRGRVIVLMCGVAHEERGGDRWTDRDGDRGTAIRVWDICMATREDSKSRWWMGGPTQGYRGRREDDNGWTGARDRRGRGRRSGQESDHSGKERVDEDGLRVERSCLYRHRAGRLGRRRRRSRSVGEGVFTRTGCHNTSWLLTLTFWTGLTRPAEDAGGAGMKAGHRVERKAEKEEGRQTVKERRRIHFELVWLAWV